MKKLLLLLLIALPVMAWGQNVYNASPTGGGGTATLDSSLTTSTDPDWLVGIKDNAGVKVAVTTLPEYDTLRIGAAYYIGNADSTWIEKPIGTYIKREDE